MKKYILSATSLLVALSLNSCFQKETTIHLKKDGSGTIIEESRLSAQMLAMQTSFNDGGDADSDPLKEMASEEKAKERATELGEGVTLEKIEPITVGTSKGVRITYRFADINKIRISTDDMSPDDLMNPGDAAKDKDKDKDKENIEFNYKDGTLSIRTFKPLNEDKGVAENEKELEPEQEEQQMALMKQVLADMKTSIKLVFDSGISETNATHRDGDTITLMEVDLNKLMENPENMKKLKSMDQGDRSAAVKLMKDIEGIKLEVNPETTVKLK